MKDDTRKPSNEVNYTCLMCRFLNIRVEGYFCTVGDLGSDDEVRISREFVVEKEYCPDYKERTEFFKERLKEFIGEDE